MQSAALYILTDAVAVPPKCEAVHREAGGAARNQGGAFPAEAGERGQLKRA